MVVQGDFEVKLVMADENKTPFLEHQKDGKVYCEVEPDAEYFVQVQRTGYNHAGNTYVVYYIDNQSLGFHTTHGHVEGTPSYRGIWSRVNGVTSTKALKFTKPKISQYDDRAGRSNLLMGKVEVKVYEAIFEGAKDVVGNERDFKSSFSAATVDLNQGGSVKKKNLRSGEGSTVLVDAKKEAKKKGHASNKPKKVNQYKQGALLDTITLNYCAALGLMEVGVLPKPDMWTYHRMKRPAEPGSNTNAVQPKKIRDAVDGKDKDLFDLAGDDE